MRIRSIPLLSSVVILAALWASAASANMEDIISCRNIDDDMARLACFDAAVPAVREELRVENEAEEEEMAELAEEQDQRSFFGLPRMSLPNILRRRETTPDEFGSAELEQRQAREEGRADELAEDNDILTEITATVVEWGRNPRGKYFMVLENGHVWRQTDDGRIPLRNSGTNTVSIRRTALGGFMLKANGVNRTFRVERIR